MLEIKINFTQIQQRLDAARSLSDAGCDKESRSILRDLARDITKKIKERTHDNT